MVAGIWARVGWQGQMAGLVTGRVAQGDREAALLGARWHIWRWRRHHEGTGGMLGIRGWQGIYLGPGEDAFGDGGDTSGE